MLSNLYQAIYLFRYDSKLKTVFILVKNKAIAFAGCMRSLFISNPFFLLEKRFVTKGNYLCRNRLNFDYLLIQPQN